MNPNQAFPLRRNMRLHEFDYSQPGAYFVTLVTHGRKLLFGHIVDEKMILNAEGKIAEDLWIGIPVHFPNVELGEFVVMPNHIHGILTIIVEATHASPLPRSPNGPIPGSLGAIIGSFKSSVTKRFHEIRKDHKDRLWQRNYYEHVIRNERDYQAIDDYILSNPLNWEKDEDYSAR